MTVLDFAGAFVESGGDDPIEKEMEIFMREEVDFDMPNNVRSWK